MDLMTASTQWMTRPDDERFFTLEELLTSAVLQKRASVEAMVKLANISFTPVDGVENGIVLLGQQGQRANISHLGFQQMATRLDYPVSGIVNKLDADLACKVLNHRIQRTVADDVKAEVQALFDSPENGDITIRSVTSERYARVYDADIIPYAIALVKERGWKVPPGKPVGDKVKVATEADVIAMGSGGGIRIEVGDTIGPSGLYRGDQDMFIFLVDDKNAVDDGSGNPLYRGIFLANSEVGVGSFSATEFLMQGVCGNHIVWGAKNIVQVRYRHIGEAAERIHDVMKNKVLGHEFKPLDQELKVIEWMRNNKLGAGEDEVVDSVYQFRIQQLTQKVLHGAYRNASQYREVDGDPDTWYGFANALTRYSQNENNADDRMAIDIGAGKLFEKAAKLAIAK